MSNDLRALVEQAVKLMPGGRQQDLADAMTAAGLPTIQQHVSKLITGVREMTAETAIAIHIATDGRVPGSATRPDLWTKPEHVPLSLCASLQPVAEHEAALA